MSDQISGLHKLQYFFTARIQKVEEKIQQTAHNAFCCKCTCIHTVINNVKFLKAEEILG